MSAQRRQELEDAGISVLCNDTDGTLFPETFVRVDVALSLCGIGTGVPPVPFFQPPPGYESERLCGRTSNDTCDTAEPFELKVNHEITLSGDTSDFSDDVDVSCGNTTGSPDAFYTFEVPAGKRVMFYADTFDPGNTFDTVLFLQEGCPGTTEVACNDDASLCPGEGGSPLFRSRLRLRSTPAPTSWALRASAPLPGATRSTSRPWS